jgi:hypothetical protein
MAAENVIKEVRSRRLRKRRDRVTRMLGGEGTPVRKLGPLYWAPRNFSWLIGTLFMIGSFCFAAGTLVAISKNPDSAGIIFFVGSLFFTSAGYGQFLQVINGDRGDGAGGKIRLFAWEPDLIEWQAAAIQSFGTLCFNVSTGFALVEALDTQQVNRLVWSPDVFGSIAFLIASWLAFKEVRSNWGGHPDRGSEWWVTVLNLAGSIAFGISAIGAYVIPDNGDFLNAAAANAGTFLGAVGFFIGAYLLWPEAAEAAAETPES